MSVLEKQIELEKIDKALDIDLGVRRFYTRMWKAVSLAVVLVALFGVLGLSNSFWKPSPDWNLLNFICLVFAGFTILSVIVTHRSDRKKRGGGIVDVHQSNEVKRNCNVGIISAIMARQAIHIAIALGLLVVIFQNKFLEGQAPALQFQTFVARAVALGFSLSVVMILVSALCYDYSCRFKWNEDCERSLVRRGHRLDNQSWYVFTISLILSIALVSPPLCILVNAVYGFLLLDYYFFPESLFKKETEGQEACQPPG